MATYLITQATGQQSQWTIEHLLAAGAKVHAIVRNPSKIPDVLKRPGVTVFKGESVNFDDVFQAAQGCKAVFLVTHPISGMETKQAQTIADAAKKAGIKSVVASTTTCTGFKDLWDDSITKECHLHDYYISKTSVEDVVRGAGFEAWTILRPALIHYDYFLPGVRENFPQLATHGELVHCLNDGTLMTHTDCSDIGKYAAAALQDPAKFGGHEIELVNDSLTIEQIRDILVRVSGRDIGIRKFSSEDGEYVQGQAFQMWVNFKDLSRCVAAGREAQAKFGIPFTSLEEALQRDKSRVLETVPVKA
ncbi:NmrA family protein [Xylaria sp. FL1777]|nr:NmrA family protein [Xylaria sp. FL1777]